MTPSRRVRDVELVKPTCDASGVAKFLTEKVAASSPLSFDIDEINGALIGVKAKHVRLINETKLESPGCKMAFVHPKPTGGVLVEL